MLNIIYTHDIVGLVFGNVTDNVSGVDKSLFLENDGKVAGCVADYAAAGKTSVAWSFNATVTDYK